MKFISITGPKNDIDRVVDVYLSKYDMHLENALSELTTAQELKPYTEVNPYKDLMTKAEYMVHKLDANSIASTRTISPPEASTIVTDAYKLVEMLNAKKKSLKEEKAHLIELKEKVEPFQLLNYDLKKILDFKFIKFRFGKVPHQHYTKFSKFVYDNLNTVFYECACDKDYVWGVYFVPSSNASNVDAVFTSMHFERLFIPDEYEGTAEEAYHRVEIQIDDINKAIKQVYQERHDHLQSIAGNLLLAYEVLCNVNRNYDVRKYAVCTKEREKDQVFYILCGWMSNRDTISFLKEIDDDKYVFCVDEDEQEETKTKPPTRLKNSFLIKPFEMFVNMYGLPAYNEIDPTLFVAITYSFIFGVMFGDVGQGLCLVVGGFLLYKFKKMNVAAIISLAGIFSTIFGFMYGSCFGYEELIPTLWLKPMEDVMTVLMVSVAFGVCLILVSMILNIINSIKSKDIEKLLFDSNGIAGLLFYLGVVGCMVMIFTNHALPGTIILSVLLGLPLLAIFLKEPLSRLVERKSEILPGNKVMFFVEALVELFDVVLSYATNTISFVRIGAFALSHAGMMGVVLLLGGAESGNTNFIIIILGNIIVAGMEGLIVGIQVLRLEYYEMFSRFYRGTGKAFKPFNKMKKN